MPKPNKTSIVATLGENTTILFLDCNLFETHQFTSEVTENPIEDGSSVVDHIINKPLQVQIEAIISSVSGDLDEAKDSFSVLNRMRSEGKLVELGTPFELYENMVITELRVINTPEITVSNGTIRFSMRLTQVKLVKSLQVTVVGVKYKKRRRVDKTNRLTPTAAQSEARAEIILKRNLAITEQLNRDKAARNNKILEDKLYPVPRSQIFGAGFLPQ